MALLSWDEVGEHISECCSKGESMRWFPTSIPDSDLTDDDRIDAREIILQTMLPFVESVDTVDSIYVHDSVPTVAQYWQRRDLTAAVYPVIATLL